MVSEDALLAEADDAPRKAIPVGTARVDALADALRSLTFGTASIAATW